MSDNEGQPESMFSWSGRWATNSLVLINVLIAGAMVADGASPWMVDAHALVGYGAVDAVRVWHGEVWRMLTACFVHVAVWHVAMNLWVLVQIGRALERLVGSARFLLLYLASGIFGFACSVMLHPGVPSAGASGAIFGVTGALLALAVLTRSRPLGKFLLTALVPFIGATLALGAVVPIIDNTAHIGGLVMGFLLCFGLQSGDRSFLILDGDVQAALRDDVSTGERVLGTASLLLALALLGVGLPSAAHTVWSPRYHAILGLQDLAHDKLDDALAHARAATRLAENDGAARIVLGRVTHDPALIADGLMHFDADPLDAFESATRALALIDDDTAEYSDPETVAALCDAALAQAGTTPQPILKNDCAWLHLKSANVHVHDAKLGLALAQQAVDESAGRVPTIVQTLSEARAQNGDLAGAITLVQGLLDTKQTTGMSVPWLHSELERLQRLQEAEKKAAAAAALVPPVVVPAPVDAAAADAAKPVDAGTVDAGTSP